MKYDWSKNIINLSEVTDNAEADECLLALMNHLGCGNFTYNFYSSQFLQSKEIAHSLCTQATEAWQAHYRQHDYEFVDPMLARIRQSRLPVRCKLCDELAVSQKQASRVYQDALDFGLEGGFAIPIHGPNGEFANLVVQDLAAHTLLAAYPEAEHQLQIFAYRYHARILQLLTDRDATQALQLTPREKQCLQLTARHLTAKQIARQLAITPRTVSFHLENVIHKLQVNSKYQAVSKAKAVGIITDL